MFGWHAVDHDDVVDTAHAHGCVTAADAVLHDVMVEMLVWIGREPVDDVIKFIAGLIAQYRVVERDVGVSLEVGFVQHR